MHHLLNPRGTSTIMTKYRASTANSLEEYMGVSDASANESFDDVSNDYFDEMKLAEADLKRYVASQITMLIGDAPVFFSKDIEQAYDELISLLNDPDMRKRIILMLDSYLKERPAEFGGFPDDCDETRCLHKYQKAISRLDGLKLEEQEAEKSLVQATEELKQYPDLYDGIVTNSMSNKENKNGTNIRNKRR